MSILGEVYQESKKQLFIAVYHDRARSRRLVYGIEAVILAGWVAGLINQSKNLCYDKVTGLPVKKQNSLNEGNKVNINFITLRNAILMGSRQLSNRRAVIGKPGNNLINHLKLWKSTFSRSRASITGFVATTEEQIVGHSGNKTKSRCSELVAQNRIYRRRTAREMRPG